MKKKYTKKRNLRCALLNNKQSTYKHVKESVVKHKFMNDKWDWISKIYFLSYKDSNSATHKTKETIE